VTKNKNALGRKKPNICAIPTLYTLIVNQMESIMYKKISKLVVIGIGFLCASIIYATPGITIPGL
jgi:hypothetical protein